MSINAYNRVILIGRFAMDPRFSARNPDKGTDARAWFSFAVRKGPKTKEAELFPVVAWKQHAENIQKWCKKGREALIEGRLRSREEQGPRGPIYVVEVHVENITFGEEASMRRDRHPEPPPRD